jgi:hypothetical protein
MIYALFGNMVRYDLARRDCTVLSDAEDQAKNVCYKYLRSWQNYMLAV